MVDSELRRADNLNSDLCRQRFAANGVRGIEDPIRLTEQIPTTGWLPIDAQVRVGHVASLVNKLGGSDLYGDNQLVPLRELIQNAADAVRARRILQDRGGGWGQICVNFGTDEQGAWLEIEDNGVGMSQEVLTGPFLDFGACFWLTPDAIAQFPSLVARGFESTGEYGIGFFSVFMWADRVRITTRRYDRAMEDTRILEFVDGLGARPILRPAEPNNYIQDGGTTVRVWPRGVTDCSSDWIRLPTEVGREKLTNPASAARWLCPTIDVDLFVRKGASGSEALIRASEWLSLNGEDLMSLTTSRSPGSGSSIPAEFLANIRPIMHEGRIAGRACVIPNLAHYGCLAVGGFRSGTTTTVAGVLIGTSARAARDEADPIATAGELATWSSEQAQLISNLSVSDRDKARCAQVIGILGGNTGDLPVARAGGTWLRFGDLVRWSKQEDSVIIISESEASKVHDNFGVQNLRNNVLVEPYGPDGLIYGGTWHDRRRPWRMNPWIDPNRPTLRAISEAWNPTKIELWKGDVIVDDEEGFLVDGEEVRRASSE